MGYNANRITPEQLRRNSCDIGCGPCAWAANRIEELEKALAPFAAYAESLPPILDGVDRFTDARPTLSASVMGKDFIITFADLRLARAAIVPGGGT